MAAAYSNPSSYSDVPAWQLALAGAIQNNTSYCARALQRAQSIVGADPAGANIRSTSETFLRIPELYDEIVIPMVACRSQTTQAQRAAWSSYLNAGLDQMWQANETYWPIDDPHNNYFHHYMYVTAMVGVATESDNPRAASWRQYYENKVNTRLIPAWTAPNWVGAGGSEGHYYDQYARRMLWTAHLYGRATGQDVVGRFGFSIPQYINYEMHATRPDHSGFWQMGDEANTSSAPFTSGSREFWLLLQHLAPLSIEAGHAKTLLAGSSTGADFPGRNLRVWNYVFSNRDVVAQPLSTKRDTLLTAPSNGHTFIRSGWDKGAAGLVLHHNKVDNSPGESHDHVDAPGFEWRSGSTGLVVDPNAFGSSGIVGSQSNGGASIANIVRLPATTTRGGAPRLVRAEDRRPSHTYHAIDAQPYWNNASTYRREYVTFDDLRVVVVFDRIVGGGSKTWQIHTPASATALGDLVTAGSLKVYNLYPAAPMTASAVSGFSGVWAIRQVDASDNYRSLKVLDAGNRVANVSLRQGAGYLEAVVDVGGAVRTARFFDNDSPAQVTGN